MSAIVLFGTGRSGTTILMEALFKHRELAYISNYLDKNPKAEGLNLLRYAFDNKLYRIFGKKEQLNKVSIINKYVFKPTEGYHVWNHICANDVNFSEGFANELHLGYAVKERINAYFKRLSALQGKEKIAFKVTGPSRLHFFEQVFDTPTYIRLSRAFIPTLSSFLHVDFWKKQKKGELWWDASVYSEEERELLEFYKENFHVFTAIQLKKILEIADHEIQELGIDVFEVRYEEFTRKPSEYLTQLLSYLNLPEDPACFRYLEANRIVNRNKINNSYFSSSALMEIKAVVGEEMFNR